MFKDEDGNWVTRTFSEVLDSVRNLSLGLMALGVEKGDKVSILANTRPEWSYFDFAALTAGAVVAPIEKPQHRTPITQNNCLRVMREPPTFALVMKRAPQSKTKTVINEAQTRRPGQLNQVAVPDRQALPKIFRRKVVALQNLSTGQIHHPYRRVAVQSGALI